MIYKFNLGYYWKGITYDIFELNECSLQAHKSSNYEVMRAFVDYYNLKSYYLFRGKDYFFTLVA